MLVSSSTCADKVSRRPRLALSCSRAASKFLSQTSTCSSYALISVSNDSICLRHTSRSVVGKILDKASILACTELSWISKSCKLSSNSLWAISNFANISLAPLSLSSFVAIVLLNCSVSLRKAVSCSIWDSKSCWIESNESSEKPSINDVSLETCSLTSSSNSCKRITNVSFWPISLACFCSAPSRTARAASISSFVGYNSGLDANCGCSVEPHTGQGSLSTTKWTSSKARPSAIKCSKRSSWTFEFFTDSSIAAKDLSLPSISCWSFCFCPNNSEYRCNWLNCSWIRGIPSKSLLLAWNCFLASTNATSKSATSLCCACNSASLFSRSCVSKLRFNVINSLFSSANSSNFSDCCRSCANVVLLACIVSAWDANTSWASVHLDSCWDAISIPFFASESAVSNVFNALCLSLNCLYSS